MITDLAFWENIASLGALPMAMFISFRVSLRAHVSAVAMYKASAADADERLNIERAQWAEERKELNRQLAMARGIVPPDGAS